MWTLTKLWTALATLATNVTTLAGTIAEANGALRGRLQLDAADDVQASALPALMHQIEADAEPGNGRRGKHTAAAK